MSKRTAAQFLALSDRAALDLPVPAEAAPPAKREGGRMVPAAVKGDGDAALKAAVTRFRGRQALLVQEAGGLLLSKLPKGRLTESEVSDRVHRGLLIAWARYLGAEDARAAWMSATAFGIFFDKWRLTQGLPTAITEERRYERVELLAKIQTILEARGKKPEAIVVTEAGVE